VQVTHPFAHLVDWRPAPVRDRARLEPGPVAALSRALGYAAAVAGQGDELPPLWHWLSFLDWPARDALGADGHPHEAGLQPPIDDRRRMWAGGSVVVHEPLVIGGDMERTVEVVEVWPVSGRSGDLLFVTTRTTISQDGRRRVTDDVDAVYRSGEQPKRTHPQPTAEPAPAGSDGVGSTWRADEILLFRFSALTANSHRIHYDAPYARDVEGYPGLVVHGPLLALLMAEEVRRTVPRPLRSLRYRLLAPVFVHEEFLVDAAVRAGEPDVVDLRVATARQDGHAVAEVGLA
jgi:itaconyl-CoA hydratase / mesaconyl-C4 CoA hydratase